MCSYLANQVELYPTVSEEDNTKFNAFDWISVSHKIGGKY